MFSATAELCLQAWLPESVCIIVQKLYLQVLDQSFAGQPGAGGRVLLWHASPAAMWLSVYHLAGLAVGRGSRAV